MWNQMEQNYEEVKTLAYEIYFLISSRQLIAAYGFLDFTWILWDCEQNNKILRGCACAVWADADISNPSWTQQRSLVSWSRSKIIFTESLIVCLLLELDMTGHWKEEILVSIPSWINSANILASLHSAVSLFLFIYVDLDLYRDPYSCVCMDELKKIFT